MCSVYHKSRAEKKREAEGGVLGLGVGSRLPARLLKAPTITCGSNVGVCKQVTSGCTLPPSAFSPLHYSLNLSIQSVVPTTFEGDVQIFAKANVGGKQVSLNVNNQLRHVEDIHVVNCDSGGTLCVAKTVFDQHEQLLSLILFDTVEAGTNLRIDVLKFTSVDNKDITYSQIAPRWNRNAPTMVGSLLTYGSAKKIFPVMEVPAQKTSFDLCIRFTPTGHVRSNAATKTVVDGQTCFEKTFPLSTHQIAFSAFEKAETLIYNRTALDGVYIPAVEIVFSLNRNFKREKHEWIYNEATKVISLMTQWTSFPYPLGALKIFSAPIRASSHSALGLITLQESLTTYLEWKVNEQLEIVNKTRAAEIETIRPKDLTAEGRDDTRVLRSLETMQSCPERFVSIFYTLDETFGQDTVINMLRLIFLKFAYSSTSISDWQQAVVEATGNHYAGQMLSEWFSRKTRPILHLHVMAQALQFEQMTDELWTVPVEVAGSSGVQLVAVTDKTVVIPYSSHDYVIADPRRKSTAMIVHDVDSYVRMIRCWDDSRCPASQSGLRGIVRDLAAVLLTNKLPAPQISDIPKWKAVFKFAQIHRIFDGNAACCAEYAISRTADIACTWVIRDTCQKISLINAVAAGA
ncbi:peptidase family M1 [Necator americanus]|uniref:Peptidase family M1 n=1 Tax=Necator americanus TaxID=51031 RepID=W2T9Y5_NECAM|nr:peptidase family M1 [Necator americanus]ETN78404.1 peptidase family M1 [Necator americanus]